MPGLTKVEIKKFKEVLLSWREKLAGDATKIEDEAARKGKDEAATLDISSFADLGSDNYEQEFDLGMRENQGETLREIDEALERIDNGTFGVCQNCGKPISKGRLAAKPHARFCVPCKSELEKTGGC